MSRKIFKIGDKVQIVNPEFFSRVGFPLTMQKLRDDESYSRVVLVETLNLLTKNTVPWYNNGCYDSKVFDKIQNLLFYSILKKENFGGDERKIYTFKESPGGYYTTSAPFTILSKKIVRTGKYARGRIKGRNNLILTIQHKNGWNIKIEAKNVRLLKKSELALMEEQE